MMTTMNGTKKYEETFVSPFQKDTKGDALKVLDEIRRAHSSTYGWV